MSSGLRKIVACFLLCVNLWLIGLIWFVRQLPTPQPLMGHHADAIVVLTGGSQRLEYGLQLLAEGYSDRLFISGVGAKLTPFDLIRQASPALQPKLQMLAPRIALGHDAVNTIGNAEETARWLKATQCKSLFLVTASYHMPRSVAEFEETLPGIRILPAPVFPDDFSLSGWWQHRESRTLLLSEYHKYVASKLRHWFVSATHRA